MESTEQASNWLYFNKYNTIAKNLTISNHNYEETGVMISEAFFQTLTKQQRTILKETAVEVAKWHKDLLSEDIAKAEAEMEKQGVNIIKVDQTAWKNHFRKNYDTLVKEIGYSKNLIDYIKSQWK